MSALHEEDRLPEAGDQPKRKPMLSEAKLTGMDHGPEPDKATNDGKDWLNWWGKMNDTPNMDAREVQAYYEDLIDKGVLVVMKVATNVSKVDFECSNCGLFYYDGHEGGFNEFIKFQSCPRCSCKIVES